MSSGLDGEWLAWLTALLAVWLLSLLSAFWPTSQE